MRISNYGVSLVSLQGEDLEMVREWRNDERVRLNMVYQDIISSEAQRKWFSTLDHHSNLYFIMKHENNSIGLINLKNIDWDRKTAESGIFMGNTSYHNSHIPVKASILLTEFAFYGIKLKNLFSTTLAQNKNALALDKQLGFISVGESTNGIIKTEGTQERFEASANKIRNTLHRKFGSKMTVSFTQDEPAASSLRKLYPLLINESSGGDAMKLQITVSQ